MKYLKSQMMTYLQKNRVEITLSWKHPYGKPRKRLTSRAQIATQLSRILKKSQGIFLTSSIQILPVINSLTYFQHWQKLFKSPVTQEIYH